MMSKAKSDVKVIKGQEAEDRVLEYIKRMNRPFGAVDVSANLKGAVPKTATQKILLALSDKGQVTQKVYGKTTFFVANQNNVDAMPDEKAKAIEAETKTLEEENKLLIAEIKTATAELSKLKSTPTDAELAEKISETDATTEKLLKHLEPLRSGTPLVSAAELELLDAEWTKWRAEWVRRRKIFLTFWSLASDSLSPQDAKELAEDLGIEYDTPEHVTLERGPLCAISSGRKK